MDAKTFFEQDNFKGGLLSKGVKKVKNRSSTGSGSRRRQNECIEFI